MKCHDLCSLENTWEDSLARWFCKKIVLNNVLAIIFYSFKMMVSPFQILQSIGFLTINNSDEFAKIEF